MLRYFFGIAFLLLCCLQALAHADPSADTRVDVHIKKTFDYGTLVEHTVTANHAGHTVVMIYSQRRTAEGSGKIVNAGLSYRPQARSNKPFSPNVQQVLLTAMIRRLQTKFGKDLNLTYFHSAGFMNVQSMELKNFQAFHHFQPWTDYLDSPAPHLIPQHKTYDMVVKRWKEKGVYTDVIGVFNNLGYQLTLESFEKLFVQRADRCAFYAKLEPMGIQPQDRFPYPGSIQFSVTKNLLDAGK